MAVKLRLAMQPYKYTVRYIPGSENIADSLSRLLSESKNNNQEGKLNETDEYIRLIAQESTPIAVKIDDIARMSRDDTDLKNIRQCLHLSTLAHGFDFGENINCNGR
jgi:hypothetical protein